MKNTACSRSRGLERSHRLPCGSCLALFPQVLQRLFDVSELGIFLHTILHVVVTKVVTGFAPHLVYCS
jgi:hypothetical protein